MCYSCFVAWPHSLNTLHLRLTPALTQASRCEVRAGKEVEGTLFVPVDNGTVACLSVNRSCLCLRSTMCVHDKDSPNTAELSLFVTFTQSRSAFERMPGRRTRTGAEVKITLWKWRKKQPDGNQRIVTASCVALLLGRKLIHLMRTCHRMCYKWLESDWQPQSPQTPKQHESSFFSYALMTFHPRFDVKPHKMLI